MFSGQGHGDGAGSGTEIVAAAGRAPQVGTGIDDRVAPAAEGREPVVATAGGGQVAGAGPSALAEGDVVVAVAGGRRTLAERERAGDREPGDLLPDATGDLVAVHGLVPTLV